MTFRLRGLIVDELPRLETHRSFLITLNLIPTRVISIENLCKSLGPPERKRWELRIRESWHSSILNTSCCQLILTNWRQSHYVVGELPPQARCFLSFWHWFMESVVTWLSNLLSSFLRKAAGHELVALALPFVIRFRGWDIQHVHWHHHPFNPFERESSPSLGRQEKEQATGYLWSHSFEPHFSVVIPFLFDFLLCGIWARSIFPFSYHDNLINLEKNSRTLPSMVGT